LVDKLVTDAEQASVATNVISDETKYWLALWRVKGIGAKRYLSLLQVFVNPRDIFSASVGTLRKTGLSDEITGHIKNFDWTLIDADMIWLQGPDCHLMCFYDEDYPALLKEISDPPPVLFIRGDRSLLSSIQIAIVGTRNPTPTAVGTAQAFSKNLATFGLTITSGLALGIDQASHKGALAANGKTIAVAATGLDRVYPARHRALAAEIVETGALVSEFLHQW
jgi:DNA processing protein